MKTLDECRHLIDAALQYGGHTHTFEDVQQMVESNKAQFWPGVDSVVITEIAEYPRSRVLHFYLAAGNLLELEQMEPILLDWGREHGCTAATLTGRRGWGRTFLTQRAGWTETLVTYGKPL